MASTAFSYQLSEEVVRWRLELRLLESDEWWVAFTNPTAGPWKRLFGKDAVGNTGEVYRFPREETRPDVVAVNDRLEVILIVEAKDSAHRLVAGNQAVKSAAVVTLLATALAALKTNEYWGRRSSYKVVAGLLWGVSHGSPPTVTAPLFRAYRALLPGIEIVGFETRQDATGQLTLVEIPEDTSGNGALLLR